MKPVKLQPSTLPLPVTLQIPVTLQPASLPVPVTLQPATLPVPVTLQPATTTVPDDEEEKEEKKEKKEPAAKKLKLQGNCQNTGKGKCPPVQLSAEQESKAVEYIKSHPILYNKKSRGYYNQALKSALWDQWGSEFGITGAQLKHWYNCMRTRYHRIVRTKTFGDIMEPRERWIYTNFAFLLIEYESDPQPGESHPDAWLM